MNRFFTKAKLYTTTLLKYYFTKELKFTWTIVLSIVIYFWIAKITGDVMDNPVFGAERTGLMKLGETGLGLIILYIKPVFVYIAGLVIISRIEEPNTNNNRQ